jgi:hypothetical protein
MLGARVRRRLPLPERILACLTAVRGPCHYTTIAMRLHVRPATKVMQACVRMAHDGRLTWCGEGLYQVPAKDVA